ncbi:hypothetical protein [Mesorhizobium sp. M0041]|uniref:hypothetical protein n=1 Tax=Mesorhizobium sp. M0041 TaxID=2956856 RepID=UPI003334EA19
MNGLTKAALVVAALAAGYAYGATMQHSKAEKIKEGLQTLLDDNIPGTTNFEIEYVEVPYTAVVPLIASPQHSGYFSVVRNDKGKRTQCNSVFDYEYRAVGDKFYLRIPSAQLATLSACQ